MGSALGLARLGLLPLSRAFRFPWRSRLGHFSNAPVTLSNEGAGAQHALFEVFGIRRKNLPARDAPASEHADRSQAGQLNAKRLVVLDRSCDPNPVVARRVALLAQDEHDLFVDVHGVASEHRACPWAKDSQFLKHEVEGEV